MIKIQAMLSGFRSLADRSIKFTVHTQEIPGETKANLFDLEQRLGWLVFDERDVKETDVPDEPVEFDGQKTMSQRLRNALYVLHESRGGKPEDFELFRTKEMERLIQWVKDRINE